MFKYLTFILILLLGIPLIILGAYLFLGIIDFSTYGTYFMQTTFINVLLHSMILSVFAMVFSLWFGAWIGMGFYTLKSKVYKTIYILLLMISFVLQPIILLAVFQQIAWFNHIDAFWQSAFIAIVHLTPLAGLAFIYIFSTLNTLAIQSALSIASLAHVLKFIVYPQIKVFVFVLCMLLFILVFIDQAVPSILGYRTYTEDLLAQMTLMESMKQIVFVALPSYILVFLFIFLGFRIQQKFLLYTYTPNPLNRISIPFKGLGISILSLLCMYILGIIITLIQNFMAVDFDALFHDNIDLILMSIVLAFSSAMVTLVVGIMIQKVLEKYSSAMVKLLSMGMFVFYLFIPHSLISLLLLDIYQWMGCFSIFGDYALFFIGYIFILLPVAIFLIYSLKHFEKKDIFLEFFSYSPWHTWIKIVLPTMYLPWTLILFILMIFSLNELSVSILLIPPGFETMVIKIYNLLHYGDKATVSFLSLVQLFFVILFFTIIGWISQKVFND